MLSDKDLVKQDPISLHSPGNPSPIQTIFLSNIDQAVNFPVMTVFFYDVPQDKDYSSTVDVAERVRKAVEEVLLVPYYFMTGRLNFNEETTRLELMCNDEGALFVSASSRLELRDLGNLAQPNPSFHLLVHYGTYRNLSETPLFTIQVTRFKCGGFVIGFMTNHAVFDGKSASEMFHNLASICRGAQGLKITHDHLMINNDRTCIKARTPPQINFPHDEYAKLAEKSYFTSSKQASRQSLLSLSDKYTHRVFTFTSETLKSLKAQAGIKCSTFEALLAHIWRARSRATYDYYHYKNSNIINQDDLESNTTVLFAVDIRDIISPPLPHSFVGNAVITAFARAKTLDLINGPLSFAVEMVKRGRERVTSEYVRSVIDWLEVHKGVPATHSDGGFYASAWWKLRFNEVDFGYGRPKHAGPMGGIKDEFVMFLNDDNSCEGNKTGINVWIGLEKDKMDRFCSCVLDFC